MRVTNEQVDAFICQCFMILEICIVNRQHHKMMARQVVTSISVQK